MTTINKNALLLIKLADQLDAEGHPDKADEIDKNFQEFLQLLEEGKLDFDFTYFTGARDPRNPYSNKGLTLDGLETIEGPQ